MPSQPISLIMTMLNEERSLIPFLSSIDGQDRLPDEVVVVDGGSTDGTLAILKSWAKQTDIDVQILVEPQANISRGRNIAIAAAKHSLIAATDAGTTLDAGWLEYLHERATPGVDVVSGFFDPQGETFMGRAIAAAVMPTLAEIDGSTFLPSSRSVLFRKSAWESVGGYPEWLDYCEDLVFDLSIKSAGGTFTFAPAARVTWNARPDLKSYAKQYYRYARGDGKARLWTKRHAARYGAYVAGTTVLMATGPKSRWSLPLVAAGAFYIRKFVWRVATRKSTFESKAEWAKAVALVPAIVAIGDVSKMVGYPPGVIWRWKNRRAL